MTDFKQELREILTKLADQSSPVATLRGVPNPMVKPQNVDEAESDIIALFISKGWVQMAYNPSEKTVAGKVGVSK